MAVLRKWIWKAALVFPVQQTTIQSTILPSYSFIIHTNNHIGFGLDLVIIVLHKARGRKGMVNTVLLGFDDIHNIAVIETEEGIPVQTTTLSRFHMLFFTRKQSEVRKVTCLI